MAKKNNNKKIILGALAAGAGFYLLSKNSQAASNNSYYNQPGNYTPPNSGGTDWGKLITDLGGKIINMFNSSGSTARGSEELARNGSGAGMASGGAGGSASSYVAGANKIFINPVLNS